MRDGGRRAALEVQGSGLVINKVVTLNGGGYRDMQVTPIYSGGFGNGSGALRNIGGSNTLSNNLLLGGVTFINTSDTGNTLYLTGNITSNQNVVKVGSGNLELGGTASNTNTSTIFVDEGNLVLNKGAGGQALAVPAMIGDLRNPATMLLGGNALIPAYQFAQANSRRA